MTERLRSAAFDAAFYAWTVVCCLALIWAPFVLSERKVTAIVRWYAGSIGVIERWVLGLDHQIVGWERLPDRPFIFAPKHQSTWETLKLHPWFGDPIVVVKEDLVKLPVWGWFAARGGLVPIDRSAGRAALQRIRAAAEAARGSRRVVVIFPQGTRVPVGASAPYLPGVALIYKELGLPVVPVALNSGLFWPKRGLRRRGTVTVEILDPIDAGLPPREMLKRLEAAIEPVADRLAGGECRAAVERNLEERVS